MKANSERVKGKNFKHFSGKPLFQWTLNTLLSVKEIDQVIINTDARELLINNGLVENDRLLIRDRRPEICGDLVSMNLIIEDDINNSDADVYLMTHTTNPMMKANTVRDALAVFNSNQAIDSLFTVDKIQTRFYDKDCNPVNHNPDNLLRTQDLEPWYEENSNLYIFTKKSFINTKARIGKNPMMYETPKFESIDIDTPSDWDLAVLINDYLLEREKQK
jgi:CMP-N-acetylneuraminic acid synthetase